MLRTPLAFDTPVIGDAIPVIVTTVPLSLAYHCLRYQVSVGDVVFIRCPLRCEEISIRISGSVSAINLFVL